MIQDGTLIQTDWPTLTELRKQACAEVRGLLDALEALPSDRTDKLFILRLLVDLEDMRMLLGGHRRLLENRCG
jgi:hypothetical protein